MKFARVFLCAAVAAAPALFGGSIAYTVTLDGPSESPANASPGTGSGFVIFDDVANTMYITVTFSGLVGTTTAAHIHCCTTTPGFSTASVATQTPTFFGFPSGVSAGSFSKKYDLSDAATYRAAFLSGAPNFGSTALAEATLLAGAAAGKAYLNIHTTAFPNGEIRGFLTATPEPATFAVAGLALAGLVALRRKKA